MTENKLKNMIENHELDTLMNNREELEKLKSSETTEQVLEILKKYNYTETKEVFERELLEILQSIKLNEEDIKNVSGGKSKKQHYLSAVMGGLMAINSAGFLPAGAVTEQQRSTGKYSDKSLLNKIDKSDALKIGGGIVVGGVVVEALNLIFGGKKTDHKKQIIEKEKVVKKTIENSTLTGEEKIKPNQELEDFPLTEEEKKIYDSARQLCNLHLDCFEHCRKTKIKIQNPNLDPQNTAHQSMLRQIEIARGEWLKMYAKATDNQLPPDQVDNAVKNKTSTINNNTIWSVTLDCMVLDRLFKGLPVGKTTMQNGCMPQEPELCEKSMNLIRHLIRLYHKYVETLEIWSTMSHTEGDCKPPK